jgi:hypothetical protein
MPIILDIWNPHGKSETFLNFGYIHARFLYAVDVQYPLHMLDIHHNVNGQSYISISESKLRQSVALAALGHLHRNLGRNLRILSTLAVAKCI